ncbi:MAG: Tn3 family transposase [Phaeospirillum sp.]|nr:Tn3 family transposase [Phaeospirillum sp.]
MPVNFLSPEQERQYGRFPTDVSAEQLARFFHLDDTDRAFVLTHRGAHMRLGCAVQLGTVRFLGTFVEDPCNVPSCVVSFLSTQLNTPIEGTLEAYRASQWRWRHPLEIRERYGYRDFSDVSAQWRLIRWLYALCWTGTDRPSVLFDQATVWLVMHKVLLPGVPRVDLPELLLEIDARTGFASAFTHASESDSRARDLPTTVCAVLLAEACNTGLEPLVRLDNPSLRRPRMSWVRQNYLRAETLTLANAQLVSAQNSIGLAHRWGGGDVASADGLRFIVPVRTIHAGPNPKYFGSERGVTYYNLVSDQFTGLHAITVPGTLRDSLVLLSVVLEQETELEPTEIMTDTGAYTDVIFAIFWLLGYQFSPRIADIGGSRFWRVDPAADYGPLNKLAAHKAKTAIITENWDDMLRLAGSLKLGLVQAGGLIRTLQTKDRPTRLARALEELGRIVKTLYLLAYIDDEAYRRRILTQLNRGEGRHQLARVVFHGKRGELRQRYREGQEDQLGALGLVVNAIILWNTIYMDAAIDQLRAEGFDVRDEDLARLSPLVHEHINMLGRYAFTLPEMVARGELRPLRSPASLSEDND